MKFISAILLLVSYVAGQCSRSITVNSQADASGLSSCSTFNGDITANAINIDTLDFSGVQSVNGSVYISNSFALKNLNFPDLRNVSGTFSILNNTQIIGLSIPNLSSVGDFLIVSNPNLRTLTSNSLSSVKGYRVVSTSLVSLGTLGFTNATYVDVSANTYLDTLEFTKLKGVSGYVNIADNDSKAVANFPNLLSIGGNSTFRTLAGLNVSSITTLSDTFNLNGNTFANFSLDSLSNVSKDITVIDNSLLTNFSIPLLASIDGGIQINNNSLLEYITKETFPSLSNVKGGVDLSGSILNVTFPALSRIQGAFSLVTSEPADCTLIQNALKSKVVGSFNCSPGKAKSSTSSSTAGSGSSGSDNTSKPSSANSINAKIGGSIVALALFFATFVL
ncbi:Protein ecm33 [Smittium mucronatum]|uniref:Protein ecm33 n=1 Tax=Smittium mucronatum TaxID=133383 RepID=A0A1R0H0U5_9FUNG|nr:Protein ecm33 [Smittium mucronatum]